MIRRTDDLRIRDIRPLIPPAILVEELPLTARAAATVRRARAETTAIIRGDDTRLIAVVGPCSIHDDAAALELADRLRGLARRFADDLVLVMRAYFEKPRTVAGWKGLINDPDLDGSYHINKGLRLARRLLLDINESGLPTASEFLDTQVPQYLADLTSLAAIGARTAESQVHRELASGLSMPVGFKNGTTGNVQIAVDAVAAARQAHWFAGVTKQGVAAILQTTGNDTCYVVLRGGTRSGPNYHARDVDEAAARLKAAGMPARVMIDCSHGNCSKDTRRQVEVADEVSRQVAAGSPHVFGVMIESHLVEGRQDARPGIPLVHGQSITDACLSLDRTVPLLEQLAQARASVVRASRARRRVRSGR
jgi:3-deoxy-7-phosphoheptulonate synthase